MAYDGSRKVSLQKKILFNGHFTMIMILLVTFCAYYYIFHYEFKMIFQHRLLTLAQTAARLINVEEHEVLTQRLHEDSEQYIKIKRILENFKAANADINYIYTMRKTTEKDIWQFVVDAEPQDSQDISHLGDIYDVSGLTEMKKAFAGPITDKEFEEDQWGTFLSGYAPILDKNGKAVAIVGIDIAADTLVNQEKRMLTGALIIFVISMGLITFATRKTVNYFLTPIHSLIKGINELRKGNLRYRTQIETNDEFQEIGDMLNSAADIMVDYQRMLEKDLASTKEQREKIFGVYRDVIYSVTQGKFNLLTPNETCPILGEGMPQGETEVSNAEDVPKTRQWVVGLLKEKNCPQDRIMPITLCLSEAVTNVVKHAEKGKVEVRDFGERVRIIINDNGPGMDFDKLPNMIFLEGFSTKISMGYGFSIIYKYANKIYMSTSTHGTVLILEFVLAADSDFNRENTQIA